MGVVFIASVSAKVLERFVEAAAAVVVVAAAAGFSAGAAAGLAGWLENGLDEAELNGLLDPELKGFAPLENGFPPEAPRGFAPNSDSPRPGPSFFFSSGSTFVSGFFSPTCAFVSAPSFQTLTPLSARTLPAFRRHVALRQAKTYSRRSCVGNFSGSSPFSCRSRAIMSLQTLHLAKAAEGDLSASSQS